MITGLLILWPLLAALLLFAVKNDKVKNLAFAASLIECLLSLYALYVFKTTPDDLQVNLPWIPALGIDFNIGMDGISLLMVLLSTCLTPLIILASYSRTYSNPNAFYGLILLMQMAMIGVFVAMDGFLFYVFWELALLPIYFICALWGGENRIAVTFKFFIYTLFGSLLMLVAIIYLYVQTPGAHTFSILKMYELHLSLKEQSLIFLAFFFAFAIKIPIFPLHTWQPDTYAISPAPATMLLAGIMLKMGVYGLIRWMPVMPLGLQEWAGVAMTLSVIGIVYASCIALVQKDLKRLIAYVSLAHVGLIAAGVFTNNHQGLQGAVIQMISHGINAVGLFFIIDIIETRTKTRIISELGGLASKNKLFTVVFMITLLGSIALPLTSGFVGEFLLLMGVYQYGAWTGAFAGLTIILGAYYMLKMYQHVMLGTPKTADENFTPLMTSEKVVLVLIALLILVIGVYPKPLLEIAEPAIHNLLSLTTKL
jgi:NADH-quinone oxidoreductase subunit M